MFLKVRFIFQNFPEGGALDLEGYSLVSTLLGEIKSPSWEYPPHPPYDKT